MSRTVRVKNLDRVALLELIEKLEYSLQEACEMLDNLSGEVNQRLGKVLADFADSNRPKIDWSRVGTADEEHDKFPALTAVLAREKKAGCV